MVFSLRCNTPSEKTWKQASLSISNIGVGIRAVGQFKAAWVGSVLHSDALVQQLTGEITEPNLQRNSGRTEQSRNYPIYTTQDSGGISRCCFFQPSG